jgi:hypothetical protein
MCGARGRSSVAASAAGGAPVLLLAAVPPRVLPLPRDAGPVLHFVQAGRPLRAAVDGLLGEVAEGRHLGGD